MQRDKIRRCWAADDTMRLLLTEPACLRTSCSVATSMNLGFRYLKWNADSDTRGPVRSMPHLMHCYRGTALWHIRRKTSFSLAFGKKSPCITSMPCVLVTHHLNYFLLSDVNYRSPTNLERKTSLNSKGSATIWLTSQRRVEVTALKDKCWLLNVCQIIGGQGYVFYMKKKGEAMEGCWGDKGNI